MKYKDPIDLLNENGIRLEHGCGIFRGKNLRYIESRGALQIGDDDFDRWANSLSLEFDLYQLKGQRQFLRWVKEQPK